uniref:Superoxide dismutase copper/zinc binding domain-containing protein n=1 Tax=Anopheles funestus TaxID=62324 RepID=A0A182R615_ANOFN
MKNSIKYESWTSKRFSLLLLAVLTLAVNEARGLNLVAHISQRGLHGEISFAQHNDRQVLITSELETTLQYPEQAWSWGIYQLPVDYTIVDPQERCQISRLGEQLWSFDDDLGYLMLPGNESTTWLNDIALTGEKGLWGKSLVLYDPSINVRICATIVTRDGSQDHLAEARFSSPITGSIYFRWLAAKESNHSDTLIHSNLFHTRDQSRKMGNPAYTEHMWKIYVTDIFESEAQNAEENCNKLQLVFDPQNRGAGNAIGDIDGRVGALRITTNARQIQYPQLFHDHQLVLLPSDLYGPSRKLYVVVFDPNHPDTFLACAKIRHQKPRTARALVDGGGMRGDMRFTQRSRFEPTWIQAIFGATGNESDANINYAKDVSSFRINQLPLEAYAGPEDRYCLTGGGTFNPMGIAAKDIPPPGYGTQDQYPVGDLSGKLLNRNKKESHSYYLPGSSAELSGSYWDTFLPLQGPNAIIFRSFSVQRYNRTQPTNITEVPWACGTVALYEFNRPYQVPILTAQVLFRYPIVGRILFRQMKDEYWTETGIIFEYLIHADGSTVNRTADHRWAIMDDAPGKDFYDWQNRCVSAGGVYNPFKAAPLMGKAWEEVCTGSSVELCRVGDLSNRVGGLAIAGHKREAAMISRKMYIDSNLPLSGHASVIGRSVVIYDDNGPKARGERLACSVIGGYHRRKVVARDWYSNGDPLTIKGKLELVQQSEYDLTNAEVDFKGLDRNSGYHVHVAPVEGDLEFPCEDSTVYGHWNPRDVDPKQSPLPTLGSTDEYELGDLSGKFGTLDGTTMYEQTYNDTRLPLFGYESIIGRSIVVHKKEKNRRWACSTLERGYSPNEAREIRAIASFHHPTGYAYGYIRLTQLIGNDNSQSDTIIEVKLRYPGKHDRNVTHNHNWNVWVNPVGVDATVKQVETRCVAAGYVWNPYYTQLADPLNQELYKQECGPDNPLRCYVGDVSARVGPISIGSRRQIFTDSNFPLEGTVSALGRSIVIFGADFSGFRFACANIEPDHDIVKYINLKKPPRFVVAQFLEDVRLVMGLPEWMLAIDSRSTKTLHNDACIQMIVHFKGPSAHKIEQDFSRLLAVGRLDAPSIYIPGYDNSKRKRTLSYRTCGVRDPNEKSAKVLFGSSGTMRNLPFRVVIVMLLPLMRLWHQFML